MNHSDAQHERRRAGPSRSLAQSEPAYGQGGTAEGFKGYDTDADEASATEFEASWHLWFLIVAAMAVAATILAVLTFQAA